MAVVTWQDDPARNNNTPPPLAGLGREADQGWGEGLAPRTPPPTLVRFAAQARKGRGRPFSQTPYTDAYGPA